MFDDRSPIYRQIAEQIKGDVLRGVLKADEQVMSTTQYAAYYRINPATAAKAFQQLVDDGVIYKRRGVGMFVAEGATAKLRASARKEFLEQRWPGIAAHIRRLDLDVEDLVERALA